MKRRSALIAGAVLMALLGLARGAGGVVLLLQGSSADPRIEAAGLPVAVLGGILVLLGLLLAGAAIGVLAGRRRWWRLSFWLLGAFVVDGAINGYVLFGRPGDAGTVVNLAAAAAIAMFLILGRRASSL